MAEQKRTVTRAPSFIIAFLCLIICCGAVSFISPRGKRSEAERQTVPVISVVRRIPAPGLKDIRFSPSSRHFCVLNKDDTVDVYSSSGVRQWSAKISSLASVVLSAEGDYIMAFSMRNPSDSKLTFIDSTGRTAWERTVDGAVWCADSCTGDGAARFVVGTGRGYVYVIDVGAHRKRYRRWRMPGAVVSIGVDRRVENVLSASWQTSALRLASLRGQRKWESEIDPAGLHTISRLAHCDRALVEYEPMDPRRVGSFQLIDETGRKLCSGAIDVSQGMRVLPSPGGRYICTGVCKMIRHKGESLRENHAVLMDDSGRVCWEKGSAFFQAVPLAVTKTGYVVISDGKKSLFLVSPTGDLRPLQKVQSPVRKCVASRDGSRLLLECRDGSLVLLSVTG